MDGDDDRDDDDDDDGDDVNLAGDGRQQQHLLGGKARTLPGHNRLQGHNHNRSYSPPR